MARRKRKRIRQRKFIIVSLVCLSFIMITGYSAFSTTLSIGAKGNVIKMSAAEKLRNVCNATSGSGLYVDTYEEGRCIYRGSNPDNYISFNNELWRIISVETDGTLKIMRNESIGSMAFDELNARNNDNNTYCKGAAGCNVWASVTGEYQGYYKRGTVTNEASLNTYLNDEYLSSISSRDYIDNHVFNVAGYDKNVTISDMVTKEKRITWTGKIGLISGSDYMRASLNSSCVSVYSSKNEPYPCKVDNYLFKSLSYRIITPGQGEGYGIGESSYAWYISEFGSVGDIAGLITGGLGDTYIETEIFPTLYLKANIRLEGKGTKQEPFVVKNF